MNESIKWALKPGLILILWVGSYLFPKKNNYVVFLPGHNKKKFDGDLKWFFLFLQTKALKTRTAWLTDNPDVAKELESSGMPVIRFRFFPIWQILRAETIIIDTRQLSLSAGRFSIVQLWHGTGYKTVGAHAAKNKLWAMLSRNHYSKYRLLTATSPGDEKQKHRNFSTANTFITGSPRNDIFFGEIFDRQVYKEKLGLAKFEKIFLYAPTFRDQGEFEPLTEKMWNKLDTFMKAKNSLFIVKKHPGDRKLEVPANLDNVVDMTAMIGDVQELLVYLVTHIVTFSESPRAISKARFRRHSGWAALRLRQESASGRPPPY